MLPINCIHSNDTLEGYLNNVVPHYDIIEATALVDEMRNKVRRYQKLYELAEKDRVDTIKNSVNYFTLVAMCEKAQKWLSMLEKGDIDKGKKYDEKNYFEVLQKDISQEIIGKEVKIKKIYKCGYETYAWDIVFDYGNKEYSISIPDTSKLTVKNITSAHDGKLTLYLSTEHTLTSIASSYDYDEIKKAFEVYVSEHQ